MRRIVLFCSDIYTSLGVIRCVGEGGNKVEVYCYGRECNYLLASRYVSTGKSFTKADDVVDYLINEYPIYEEKPVLLTIPDPPAYLVDLHKEVLESKFVVMSAGEAGAVIHWMSKVNISNLAVKYGLTVPWSITINKNNPIPNNLTYPVFTKSVKTMDGGKCDESICWNKAELENKAKTIKGNDFLVMKYVLKEKEINYFGLALDGKIYIDYHDERPRFKAGSYGHYNTFHRNEESSLLDNIKAMMLETGYNGLFDVEFIQGKDGVLYFMEVNFRIDGEVYKLLPGINYPMEWYRLINLKLSNQRLPDNLKLGKYNFTGMTECSDFRENVVTGKLNPIVWFWQFLKADKHMLVNIQDPMPMLVKCKNMITRYF